MAAACGSPEEPNELPMPGPDDNCVPMTCGDVGATCGSADNGCGELLSCGGCDEGACSQGACRTDLCVPLACADVGAQCGEADDGCGGVLDCGGCDEAGTTCQDNSCQVLLCGAEGKNECGDCGPLALELGAPCACEGVAACTGTGLACDDGGLKSLPETSDREDSFSSAGGVAELSIQTVDRDSFDVRVVDRSFALVEPEFQIKHPGGYIFNVCVRAKGEVQDFETTCALGSSAGAEPVRGSDGVANGCCVTLDATAQDGAIVLDVPHVPFSDLTAVYTIETRARRADFDVPRDSCDAYEISYRF